MKGTQADWEKKISDPDEVKVFKALDGPQITWRTLGGLSRQSGLSEEKVREILDRYDLVLTRRSDTPAISGSALVGLIERVGG